MTRFLKSLPWFAMLALLLAPNALVRGQDAPKPDDKPAEKPAEKADPNRVTFPFELEGLMFVQVKVNGKGPYKFLFDSGATQSVLNQRLTKELGLEEHDAPGGIQGVGTAEAKLVVLDSMDVGGFSKGKSVAASMNFDHMSGSMGFHMMGIVGQNVIKMMKKIEIDFSTLQFHVTKYGEDEKKPRDMDEMIANMLEGGAMPDFPGLPGLPGGDDEPPKKKPEDKKPGGPRKEEEFSAPGPAMRAWLLQDGADPKKAEAPKAKVASQPDQGMTLRYTTLSFPLVGELVPYWNLKCDLDGQKQTLMFDTGASVLLAIATDAAETLGVPTSFSFPVKGIGKGSAKAGVLETFKIGTLEIKDPVCTVMDLPKISDQLPEGIRDMVVPILKSRGIDIDFDGIVGLPLALRYKKMIVDVKGKSIEFVAWGKDEINKNNPAEEDDFIRETVIRTWNGKAGKVGLDGDSVALDDWKKYGLKDGGLMVESVEADGAAAKAGIKKGDIITHLVGEGDMPEMEDTKKVGNDAEIRDLSGFIIWACSKDPGAEVTLRIKRGDEVKDIKFKLDSYAWKGAAPERFKTK